VLIKPPRLEKGQTIGVIGPAGPMQPERLEHGIEYLKWRGFQVKLGSHIHDRFGYLAGIDKARLDDLHDMTSDPEVHAIFCTRGGYGSPRLLHRIDYNLFRQHPKIFVGYSDITALQLALWARANLATFTGPMVAVEMGKGISEFTENHFWETLQSTQPPDRMTDVSGPLQIIQSGTARGRLLGGCLSLVTTLVGTSFLPDLTGSILFLEDIGEEPYQIDRRLMQLKLSGILGKISGLVFGQFHDCAPEKPDESLNLEQVIREVVSDLNIPVVMNLPYGHIDTKYTLPIGVEAVLNADHGYLEILESGVS